MQARAQHWFATLGHAALFGLLLVAPLAWMEWWNNPVVRSGEFPFPWTLFVALWLLPSVFYLNLTAVVQHFRARKPVWQYPNLLLRVAVLAFVAISWLNLVRDQMPCFLGGVPGCD
jgi:hypothetical protein